MANVNSISVRKEVKSPHTYLDTLAHLGKKGKQKPLQTAPPKAYTTNQESFQKRAKSKAVSDAMVFKLVALESKLNKSYWQTYHCSRTVIQDGNRLTARYCNQRFCTVCNRIRASKLMKAYLPSIDAMQDPQFVTLTRKNVKASYLRITIEDMVRKFDQSLDVLKKRGIRIKGIRKTESTINETTFEMHPHFHVIVDGKENAQLLVAEWYKRNQGVATLKAQDVRPLVDAMELFKYFTKMLTKSGQFLPVEMDKTFIAMRNKRVYQAFGGIRKESEDIEVKELSDCDWKDPQTEIWTFQSGGRFSDWYNAHGEALSEIEMQEDTMHLIEKISR